MLHDTISNKAETLFKVEVKEKPTPLKVPHRIYELRSQLRKLRKKLRRHKCLGKNCDEVHHDIWQQKRFIREMWAGVRQQELQRSSLFLNERQNNGIQHLFDNVEKK